MTDNVTPLKRKLANAKKTRRITITVPDLLSTEQAKAIAEETLGQFALWNSRGAPAVSGVVMPHELAHELATRLIGLGLHEGHSGQKMATATCILAAAAFPASSTEELGKRSLVAGLLARVAPAVTRLLGVQPKLSEDANGLTFADEASGKAVVVTAAELVAKCEGRNWREVAGEVANEIVAGLRLIQ